MFDPKLGVPLPERSYGEDCRIYTPENPDSNFANVMDSVDFYIYVHLIGWFFKMLIVRDWKFCQFMSIFFEFLEYTFGHWLPNFNECWFDHLIFDVMLANSMGILLAHFMIKAFKIKVSFSF